VTESHDRKGFLRQLLRGAAQTAFEVGDALREVEQPAGPGGDPWQLTVGGSLGERPVAAEPAKRRVGEDELRRLAVEAGLGDRLDDVVAQARTSFRMTRGEWSARSRLGGAPDLPPGFAWPARGGRDLAFVGQIRLEEVAAVAPPSPLPDEGALLCFFDLDGRPNGYAPADRGSCRVVLLDAPAGELERAPEQRATLLELPLAFSAELTLPGEAAGLPASLALDPDGLDAWQRLREALAGAQGVEVEDRAEDWHALHRLLGHPDTTADGMQLDAQLASAGIDLAAGEHDFDPRVDELRAGAERWRLLLQVSADDDAGLDLGYPVGRLHVWIREEALAAGRFDELWAFVR
jgi:uncharacterized protein YwqG